MNRHIGYMGFRSSSICKELSEATKTKKIVWIQFKGFTDYLNVQGIAYDDIPWFYTYLRHMKTTYRVPSTDETFFAHYDNRVFAISRSKYTGEIRVDFTSSFEKNGSWQRIVNTQGSLLDLFSIVDLMFSTDDEQACEDILYATDCIHA